METEDRNFLIDLFDEEFSSWKSSLGMWSCINVLGIKPFKDGNQWCFLYGENIQEGIVGFGDTIYEAACNFYEQIIKEKIVK